MLHDITILIVLGIILQYIENIIAQSGQARKCSRYRNNK